MNRLGTGVTRIKNKVSTILGCGILHPGIQISRKPVETFHLKPSDIKGEKPGGYKHVFSIIDNSAW